jgi:hypothetical protein
MAGLQVEYSFQGFFCVAMNNDLAAGIASNTN